jgi:hypothetical protein
MKNILFILIPIVFASCSSREYNLNRLENRQLKFSELPTDVQMYLSRLPRCGESNMLLFVEISDTTNYSLETIRTIIGPWVDYEKLIDKRKGFSYKINQGIPSPYIIFRNKLFIPDRFNILCGESVFEAKYTEYQLKCQ